MSHTEYLLTFVRGIFYGLLFLGGSALGICRSKAFRARWYWWLVLFAAINCIIRPFVYIWVNPSPISIREAFLMQTHQFGVWRVAEGYFVLIGVLVGGLIGFAYRQLSSRE